MNYGIQTIEGIAAANARKLSAAEIRTTGALLRLCCNRKGRRDVSRVTGISEKLLLKWANMADLMRIKGVGEEYSELLEAAGVDTVKELKRRRAVKLFDQMAVVNDKKKLVRRAPTVRAIENWIAQARTLKPVITH